MDNVISNAASGFQSDFLEMIGLVVPVVFLVVVLIVCISIAVKLFSDCGFDGNLGKLSTRLRHDEMEKRWKSQRHYDSTYGECYDTRE